MNKFKNNKGITGVDIAISLTIIIISIVLVVSIYSSYNSKSKEIKRNTRANNLLMTVIQQVNQKDFEQISNLFLDKEEVKLEDCEEFSDIEIDDGYEIFLTKLEMDEVQKQTNLKIQISVKYKIGKATKSVELVTIKQLDSLKRIEEPNLSKLEDKIIIDEGTEDEKEYNLYCLKFDIYKNGYVLVEENKQNWYSYDAKKYAISVYAEEDAFDINGVIKLEDCYQIYLWIPVFGEDEFGYKYCIEKTIVEESENRVVYYPIEYSEKDGIVNYKLSTEEIEKVEGSSNWILVDEKFIPIEEEIEDYEEIKNAFEILKNNEFKY